MQLNFKMHHRWGKQSKFILILMIKTTLVRNNHKFTLNKLLVGSIYLEASQNIVVDLNTTPTSENKCTKNNDKLTKNRNLKLNQKT